MLPIKKRKTIGQHLLINKDIIFKICDIIIDNIPEGKYVLFEIGAGEGTLTFPLLEKLKHITNKPSLIILNEIDYRYIKKIHYKLEEKEFLKVFKIDFFATDFLQINLNIFEENIYLVGNIPFYITGKLFRKMVNFYNKIILAVINFQKEVVDKISNLDNPLGISFNIGWQIEKKVIIHPSFYSPPPKVFSQIVLMKNKNNLLFSEKFVNFVYKIYRRKNKALKNILTHEELSKILKSLGNEELLNKRPLQINTNEIIKIYNLLYN